MSEWLDLMLEEVERKSSEQIAAKDESARRASGDSSESGATNQSDSHQDN